MARPRPHHSEYDLYVGIDYSGAKTPEARLKELQVYVGRLRSKPVKESFRGGIGHQSDRSINWTRAAIAEWLITQAKNGVCFIAGIDHAFSFPISYFERYGLHDWNQFLGDFVVSWPTDRRSSRVDDFRVDSPRTGSNKDFRLCETWTSSAKSVFLFDVQGSVAKSTHAGIPWLRRIRDTLGDQVHFWPFDGWEPPPGKAVIAEVYPSVFRNRYARVGRTADEHDAYAVAQWLVETAERGHFPRYFHPPLTEVEKERALREGWILGIS